jgi:hypothetical protein
MAGNITIDGDNMSQAEIAKEVLVEDAQMWLSTRLTESQANRGRAERGGVPSP